MKLLFLILPVFFTLSASAADKLTIGYSKGYGTAITSLKYHGVQYLDNSDHGRSLQSAVSFNGRGECYNPTEAGSWAGAAKQNSSKVLARSKKFSIEKMGWWYNPGDWCINEQKYTNYPFDDITSDYELRKRLSISGNILTITTEFYSPREHFTATFEALTAYVPSHSFPKLYSYDLKLKKKYPREQNGEQRWPVIASDTMGSKAIALYSPDLPESYGPDLVGYGVFDLTENNVNKLNCVFRRTDIAAKSFHKFTCQVIVGSLEEVENTLQDLYHNKFQWF